MEIDRRNFIKLIVGGVAGIHATPLPWKLTDDIAIWTQNWPWVPVPPTGEFTEATSVCSLCPGGCGIEVRKVDERAVKIEGRTDYPINPGGLCPLGMGGLQLLYNEDIRFTGPMRRVGPRGAGNFMDIGWDEALGELARRITALREKGSPEAITAVDGNRIGSTMSLLVARLLNAIGTPNHITVPSIEDTYFATNVLMQGNKGPVAYDLENADYILSFGAGLLEGWGAPGRIINAWGLWHEAPLKGKVNIVQVESRASNTASKSDQWIATKPGSDAALALAIAHVMIKEKLYDADFVDNHCFGFEDWSSGEGKRHRGLRTLVLEKYAPAQVASITGLKTEDIVSLAKGFAQAKAPLAVYGKGKGVLNGSLYECMAVHGLNALVGNINKPGGFLVHDPLPLAPLPDVEMDTIAQEGLKRPRLDEARSPKYPFSESLLNNFAKAILSESSSPVDTLLFFSSNPAFTLPDSSDFMTALKKIPFIVSFSPFRDETSSMADLILPDHTYLEKTDEVIWPIGLQYPFYALSRPLVGPIYEARNSGDVIIQLAKRVGGSTSTSFPWSKYEEVLKERAKGLHESGNGMLGYDGSRPVWESLKGGDGGDQDLGSFDDMWKNLISGGFWYRISHQFKNWESVFKTPTGKFEFFSTRIELALLESGHQRSMESVLKDLGIQAEGDEVFMPHYEAAPTDADPSGFPLLLVPYEMINLASGWIPNPPFLFKTLSDLQLRGKESFAEIHPSTATVYNVKQGDRVIIESPKGRLAVRVNLFEGAMPGVIYLPFGLGHTAYDELVQGKGVNPNEIIQAGKDPLSGLPLWWHTPVRLAKI